MAFGTMYSLSNISHFIAGTTISLIENRSEIGGAFGIGALICLYSTVCAIMLVNVNIKQAFNDKQILENLEYL